MLYLIQCLDKIKIGSTSLSLGTSLAWLQSRIPWHIKVLAIPEGTPGEEQGFHRGQHEPEADYCGNDWNGLDMLEEARDFLRLPETISYSCEQV